MVGLGAALLALVVGLQSLTAVVGPRLQQSRVQSPNQSQLALEKDTEKKPELEAAEEKIAELKKAEEKIKTAERKSYSHAAKPPEARKATPSAPSAPAPEAPKEQKAMPRKDAQPAPTPPTSPKKPENQASTRQGFQPKRGACLDLTRPCSPTTKPPVCTGSPSAGTRTIRWSTTRTC